MDINKILVELRAERENIERAIKALERVGGKRTGRPPKWMKEIEHMAGQNKKPPKDKGN